MKFYLENAKYFKSLLSIFCIIFLFDNIITNNDLTNLCTLDWDNKQTIDNISIPVKFIPTKNGLLIANAGGVSGTYVQIIDNTAYLSIALGLTPTLGNVTVNCIVNKNRQYTIDSNGTNALFFTFVPFK